MKYMDENISADIERVAREEFLLNGYDQTSTRGIVNKCGVSTQTIYLRYGSKEGLFDYLVRDTARSFMDLFEDVHNIDQFNKGPGFTDSARATDQVLDYIYNHFEDFKLIFCKSQGTKYEFYMDKLIEIEEQTYLDGLDKLGIKLGIVEKFFVHKKASEGMKDLYEIVYHDLGREEAKEYMELIKAFRLAGWEKILNISLEKKSKS